MIDDRLLCCPACHGNLRRDATAFACVACSKSYPIVDGVPRFVPEATRDVVASHARKASRLRTVLAPPHHSLNTGSLKHSADAGPVFRSFLQQMHGQPILNIGSLSIDFRALHDCIINLDLIAYPNVDVVGDAHMLPFRDRSLKAIVLKNVLEHVKDPATVISEARRVLSIGGKIFAKIPFLQPFHAVPDHYQNFTESGVRHLFKDFSIEYLAVGVGPGSMLAWILREWLAILCSFGNPSAYRVGLVIFGWLTFWMKYTDFLFVKNPFAGRVASAFVVIATKSH
jgi:uncharacterized protein YbaR (Trm112 family)